MKEVVTKNPDIAFFIKLYPLPSHPNAKAKAEAILCAKLQGSNSAAEIMLAASLAGKSLPAPECENDQVEKNIVLAEELYISSTPTLIMPDGRVMPGFKEADKIVAALRKDTP